MHFVSRLVTAHFCWPALLVLSVRAVVAVVAVVAAVVVLVVVVVVHIAVLTVRLVPVAAPPASASHSSVPAATSASPARCLSVVVGAVWCVRSAAVLVCGQLVCAVEDECVQWYALSLRLLDECCTRLFFGFAFGFAQHLFADVELALVRVALADLCIVAHADEDEEDEEEDYAGDDKAVYEELEVG